MFPIRLAPKAPNNMPKNPPFCYFISLLIVSVTPFGKIFEFSRAWTIFITLFISLFEIIKVVVPEPFFSFFFFFFFFWVPALVAVLYNDHKNPQDWIILKIWALDNFKSVGI